MGWLQTAHMILATVSVIGFVLRIGCRRFTPSQLQRAWVRTVPHVIDTALLGTGAALAWTLALSPLATPWLGAKLGAIAVYIIAGAIALRHGRTARVRRFAFAIALVAIGYVVATAISHRPWPLGGVA